jgi:hypothetical protein
MIVFHRFLIATAICFCLVFAAWAFTGWRERGDVGALALAAAFAAAGLALGYYLKHLNRFLRR